ncbi:SLAP domain-containing protein [Lactobacillus sp. ESL0259]|uniref:SLAP domain-containing protein n=1 Tax=Lactobacillus sp. ESL0259 TaxID=2069346 RepID=UPI000EFCB072|nr:SLAP domain-containing protein [Lactobacillus sp. ESL0259]RMC61928.1 YSIRK-type signal peptide-containing protein [Lactobacillus sp. ESL0259]
MFGKNNYNERLRKMEMQTKQDRFSIRKLTIGTASVLLGFTFLGLSSQTVKADNASSSNVVADTRTVKKDSVNVLENDDSLQAKDKKTKNEGTTDTKKFTGASSGQSDIESARNTSINNVKSVMSSAVSRVMAAYNKLNPNEQAKVKESLNKFIDEINATQNEAVEKIKNSGTKDDSVAIAEKAKSKFDKFATTAEVLFAKTAAIDIVNDVAQKVKNELIKESDIEKLESITQNANDELTQADDVGKINNIREEAVNNIKKEVVNNTVKANFNADSAVKDVDKAKEQNKNNVDSAAQAAINRVNAAYRNLTSAEQTANKGTYDQAITDINNAQKSTDDKIAAALSENEVTAVASEGTGNINRLANTAELAFVKITANDAVEAEATKVKNSLKEIADRNKVDEIVAYRKEDIGAAENVDNVNRIKENAIKAIDNVKSKAEQTIQKAKETSKASVDEQAAAAKKRVQDAYNSLTPDEQKTTEIQAAYNVANNAIDKAKSVAEDAIAAAQTNSEITTAVDKANKAFTQAAADAELTFAKVAATDMIEAEAAKVKSGLKKEEDKTKVDNIVSQAQTDLGNAESVTIVGYIRDQAIRDIDNVKATADAIEIIELENAKTTNKANIDKAAEAATQRVKDAYNRLNSTEKEQFKADYNKALSEIDQVKNMTNAAIAAAETVDEAVNTATKGSANINSIADKKGLAFTKEAAKAAIKEVAENAKSGLKKQEDKDKVDAIVDQANKDIDAATSLESVNSTRDQAINDIKGIKNTLDLKQRLIQARESAIKAVQNRFGKDTDISSIVAAFNDAQIKLNEKPQDLTTELNGEKEIAQGALTDAKTAANKLVDGHSDYSDTVKEQIKQQIQKDYDDFSNRVKESAPDSELITQIRDDSIDKLYRDATGIIVNKVENIINGGGSQVIPVTPAPISTNKPDNSKEPEQTKSEKVVLMHNAYLYNNKGQRANGITLGAGSVLDTYGIETINGNQYYVLVDKGANNKKYYVAIGNVNSTVRKLKHNAYIYNQYGKRVKKAGKLEAGKAIPTYGNSVKIRGKKYFIIAKNRYVKVANIASQDVTLKQANAGVVAGDQSHMFVTKKVMHNAYLYDQYGVRANGLIINAGSIVAVSAQKVIDSKIYYVLEDGLYIAAGNIDAKKLKLKHNAYVYSKYGNRLGKKVLKKHQTVKTYGKPVKIKGKKYYIMTTSKFVKKANVKG